MKTTVSRKTKSHLLKITNSLRKVAFGDSRVSPIARIELDRYASSDFRTFTLKFWEGNNWNKINPLPAKQRKRKNLSVTMLRVAGLLYDILEHTKKLSDSDRLLIEKAADRIYEIYKKSEPKKEVA